MNPMLKLVLCVASVLHVFQLAAGLKLPPEVKVKIAAGLKEHEETHMMLLQYAQEPCLAPPEVKVFDKKLRDHVKVIAIGLSLHCTL